MKKAVSGITFAVLSLISASSFAGNATGKITEYHLNSSVPGRGACIQMNQAISTGGWACLYLNNPLYKELNAMLLSASIAGKTIQVNWTATDANGFAIFNWATSY